MIEGPTIGDWTQYGWIPDEVSSFPARVRLRDSAWMVYYEANVGDERERTERLELREQNAELRDENAKLREELDAAKHDLSVFSGELVASKFENAKLREYAAKAWSLFIRHGAVHTCDLSEVDAVRDGLRELGIEVDW